MIADAETLRGRARAGYYEYEQVVAASLATDLGVAPDALVAQIAATGVIAGLRELYEAPEAAEDREALLTLVDQVLAFARGGIEAAT